VNGNGPRDGMTKTAQRLLPDRYEDLERIASGGVGDIYRATDSVLGRPVAVKLLGRSYATNPTARSRFLREALAAARLSGDRDAVTIFDVGEWEGRPYIVMEHMSGGSLEERLAGAGAQEPAQALEWLEQAARALDHAHREGVVHRDVKPGNLLLDAQDDVHVADFGIASASGMDALTQTGTVLGTAGYLAPEQARGETAAPASDRYALGVVAFELLTGRRPYANDSPTAEAAAHINAPVPHASSYGLPRELDPVFEQALAKDPAARFRTCAELVAALRDAFDRSAGRTRVLPVATPVVRPLRIWPWLVAALVLASAGGVGLAAVLSSGDGKAQRAAAHRTTAQAQPTTTAPQPAAATPATPPPPDGHALNDQGYALLQQGNPAAALPLLQQAVQALQGTGPADPTEAYANYNLGVALMELGRCPEAIPYLQRATQLEPDREEAQQALAQAEQCANPAPAPHDHGKHKGEKKHKH
jgi:eukaryotic-like serine/threonine-protein kinase